MRTRPTISAPNNHVIWGFSSPNVLSPSTKDLMSTIPSLSGPPLYRYIPGVGKVASSVPGIQGPTGPQGVPGTASATGATGPTGPTSTVPGPTGPTSTVPGPTETCATAFSTVDQPLVAGTAANVVHSTVPFSYGITVVTGANGYFQVPASGVYKIIPSLQILGGGNGRVIIWIKVNGENVPDSATLTLFKNGEESVVTCEYLLELTANNQLQIWAITAAANGSVEYHNAGGSGVNAYPAAPGVITNMYRIR